MQDAKRSEAQRRRSQASVRRRSSPQSGQSPPDTSSVGEVYLKNFSPPALANSSDVYMQTYAVVRAILDNAHWRHATTAVQAAWDAAAQHVNQSLATSGGQSR